MRIRRTLPILAAAALIVDAPRLRAQESIAKLGSFQTPSGNIHCEEWRIDAARQTEVRCDVLQSSTRRRRRPADCELDYGFAFALSARGRGSLLCVGDTLADPAHPVLAYDATWRGTGITCALTRARLRCVNLAGHGFELSRHAQRLW